MILSLMFDGMFFHEIWWACVKVCTNARMSFPLGGEYVAAASIDFSSDREYRRLNNRRLAYLFSASIPVVASFWD